MCFFWMLLKPVQTCLSGHWSRHRRCWWRGRTCSEPVFIGQVNHDENHKMDNQCSSDRDSLFGNQISAFQATTFFSEPIPASFCSFLSFPQWNNSNIVWYKHRWCAWDSNPGRLNGRCKWAELWRHPIKQQLVVTKVVPMQDRRLAFRKMLTQQKVNCVAQHQVP